MKLEKKFYISSLKGLHNSSLNRGGVTTLRSLQLKESSEVGASSDLI